EQVVRRRCDVARPAERRGEHRRVGAARFTDARSFGFRIETHDRKIRVALDRALDRVGECEWKGLAPPGLSGDGCRYQERDGGERRRADSQDDVHTASASSGTLVSRERTALATATRLRATSM